MKRSVLKKAIALVAALLLTVSVCPTGLASITVSALSDGYFTYTVTDGEVTITACDTAAVGDVEVPSEINGAPVTGIASLAFKSCKSLTSVTLPEGIVEIGKWAFYSCTGLTTATLPGSVITLGDAVFENCTGLTAAVIGEGVTTISASTFSGCRKLESVTIPATVTTVGANAFYNCNALTDVYYGKADQDGLLIDESNTKLLNATWHYTEAADDVLSYDFYDDMTATVIGFENASGSVIVPETVVNDGKTYTVTAIAENAFAWCETMTDVTIPDTVVEIGAYAFNGCAMLTTFIVSENNTAFCSQDGVLFDKNKTELVLFPQAKAGDYTVPDGVQVIGDRAFYGCSAVTVVTLPSGVLCIGERAFRQCTAMTGITLPVELEKIVSGAFYGCTALTDVYYGGTEQDRTAIVVESSNVPLEKATWHYAEAGSDGSDGDDPEPEVLTYEFNDETTTATVTGYVSSVPNVTIPETVKKDGKTYTVTAIGMEAFKFYTALEEIDIPATVTYIDAFAFYGCTALKEVVIPEGVDTVRYDTFNGCTSLTSVRIPLSVTCFEVYAFNGCESLTDVYYGGGEQDRIRMAFNDYNEPILNATWHYDELDNPETDGDGDTTEPNEFTDGALTYELDDETMTAAVTGCDPSVVEVMTPSTVVKDGVTYTVTRLDSFAFSDCSDLTTITLGDGIVIDGWSFYGCSALENIMVSDGNSAYTVVDGVVFTKDMTELVYYPSAKSETAYTVPDGVLRLGEVCFACNEYLVEIALPETLEVVGYGAFQNCPALREMVFPASVTDIDNWTFEGCTALVQVELPQDLTYVAHGMFAGCERLKVVNIPDCVQWIGEDVFSGCVSLSYIVIPDGVTSIGWAAFYGCKNMTQIVLPASIETIDVYAFDCCDSLVDVYYGGTAQDRESIVINEMNDPLLNAVWHYDENYDENGLAYEFDDENLTATVVGCDLSVTSVTIPATVEKDGTTYTVTVIGQNAFRDCSALTEIVIPEGVLAIEDNAFSFCFGVTEIVLPDSVKVLGGAFYATGVERLVIGRGLLEINGSPSVGSAIKEFVVSEDNAYFTSQDGVLFNKDMTELICYPSFKFGSYTVPDGVKRIGEYAFFEPLVTELVIPSSVTDIDPYAFARHMFYGGGYSFAAVTVAEDNPAYTSVDGVLFTKDMTTLLLYPEGKEDVVYTVPNGVTHIADNAFAGCVVTEVVFPEGVTHIGKSVFLFCDYLAKVTLPASVTSIDVSAFSLYSGAFTDVYYGGEEKDRANIDIGVDNDALFDAVWHYNEVLAGDANGDGEVNNKDVGLLQRYITGWEVTIDLDAADVNNDGKVNAKDVGLMQRFINGWKIELI